MGVQARRKCLGVLVMFCDNILKQPRARDFRKVTRQPHSHSTISQRDFRLCFAGVFSCSCRFLSFCLWSFWSSLSVLQYADGLWCLKVRMRNERFAADVLSIDGARNAMEALVRTTAQPQPSFAHPGVRLHHCPLDV